MSSKVLIQAKSRIADIIKANQLAPNMVVGLFAEHLHVLDEGPDSYVAQVMARDPAPSLEEFERILQSLEEEAHAVRVKSTNTVCTGLFRFVL